MLASARAAVERAEAEMVSVAVVSAEAQRDVETAMAKTAVATARVGTEWCREAVKAMSASARAAGDSERAAERMDSDDGDGGDDDGDGDGDVSDGGDGCGGDGGGGDGGGGDSDGDGGGDGGFDAGSFFLCTNRP